MEVHKTLGLGLLESVYEKCLCIELELEGIIVAYQVAVPVFYKGCIFNTEYRLDLLVEDILVVELKVMDGFHPIHKAQVLTYMELLKKPKGLILNFNGTNIFKEGQKTFVKKYFTEMPDSY